MTRCLVKHLLWYTLLATTPVMAVHASVEPEATESVSVVRHYQKAFRYTYHLELLDLVMSATEEQFGRYRLQPVPENSKEVSEARGVRFLENGKIDVVFLSASQARERKFRPVNVPLLKGLLGFRLLLIDRDQQNRFGNLSTLSALTGNFTAGYNPHWVDYGIYRANGFNLIDSVNYEDLFSMLERGRFDFIPRGVNEVWQELKQFEQVHPTLQVERRLALFYPYPVYFYVEQENHRLHERLKQGLHISRRTVVSGNCSESITAKPFRARSSMNGASFNSTTRCFPTTRRQPAWSGGYSRTPCSPELLFIRTGFSAHAGKRGTRWRLPLE